MRKTICITFILALAASCEKKPYPKSVTTGEAAFYFEGTVDGVATRLEAGREGYFMYSGHKIADSVSSFTARLREKDCEPCGQNFEIILFNSEAVPAGQSILTPNSLAAGPRDFYSAQAITAQFDATFNRQAASYEWDFGDGSSVVAGLSAPHTYAIASNYKVCLKVTAENGCVSHVCNTYDLSSGGLRTAITAQPSGQKSFLFSNITSGASDYEFEWNFGDGTFSSQPSPLHSYAVEGSYPVVLTVRDDQGRTAIANYNVVTSGDQSSCAANFRLVSVASLLPPWQSKVEITWNDQQGGNFSTAGASQRATDFFEIVETDSYEPNERGEPTKRVRVRFSCTLSDGSKVIHIDNAEAVIGVSHN